MRFNCPHCLSLRVRPQPYRWYEWPLAAFWVRPFVCRRCDTRFLRSAGLPFDSRRVLAG